MSTPEEQVFVRPAHAGDERAPEVVEAEVDSSWLDASVRFNANRPHGTVMDGGGTSRVRYVQDGNYFDARGELVKE